MNDTTPVTTAIAAMILTRSSRPCSPPWHAGSQSLLEQNSSWPYRTPPLRPSGRRR
jgi:hypothetical protein